ncbi:hypothetical protein J2S58_002376 [Nakamurella flavida]|nr:hypothetical protein [Nakamurella flavida]
MTAEGSRRETTARSKDRGRPAGGRSSTGRDDPSLQPPVGSTPLTSRPRAFVMGHSAGRDPVRRCRAELRSYRSGPRRGVGRWSTARPGGYAAPSPRDGPRAGVRAGGTHSVALSRHRPVARRSPCGGDGLRVTPNERGQLVGEGARTSTRSPTAPNGGSGVGGRAHALESPDHGLAGPRSGRDQCSQAGPGIHCARLARRSEPAASRCPLLSLGHLAGGTERQEIRVMPPRWPRSVPRYGVQDGSDTECRRNWSRKRPCWPPGGPGL